MSGHGKRVLSGVAAHLYAQLVTVVTQLATLPLFLSRWSAAEYGQWLLVSAVPVYLSLADAGLLTAAGNSMTMSRAGGRLDEVNAIFRSGLRVMAMLLPGVWLLLAAVVALVPFGMTGDQRLALVLLGASALLTVGCGLYDAAYRAFEQYPRITVLLTTARVLEWLGTLAGVFLDGSLAAAAFGFMSGRLVSCLALFWLAQRDLPELRWTLRGASAGDVRALIRSGVGFVSFPVGTLLTIQGMVLLVGAQFGAVAVATFNSCRTLTRLLTQVAVLTGKALAPEISALHGVGKVREAEQLAHRVARIVLPLTLVGAALLSAFGGWFIALWGRGKIPFDAPLMWVLVAAAVASAWWQIRSVRLTATNSHAALAAAFLPLSVVALVIAWAAAPARGQRGAGAGSLVCEIGMVAVTAWALKPRFGAPAAESQVRS
jgi:O-antigen/teichoic acid export membrane protein